MTEGLSHKHSGIPCDCPFPNGKPCHHPTQVGVYDMSEPPVYKGSHCGSCGEMMGQIPYTPVDQDDPDERFIDEPQGDELAEDGPRRCASDCICHDAVAVAPV